MVEVHLSKHYFYKVNNVSNSIQTTAIQKLTKLCSRLKLNYLPQSAIPAIPDLQAVGVF